MKRLHPCTGCRFFYGDFEYNRCCNYIFVMGHRRPCPPGSGCTVREPLSGHRRSSWRRYVVRRVPVVLTRVCPHCGREFATTNSTKRYCSAVCRGAARNLRKQAARRSRKAGTSP